MVVRGMISIATDLGINSSTDEWPVLSTRYVDSDISLCVRTDNDTNCRLRPEKRSTLRIIEWPQAYIKFLVLQACLRWESHESLENGLMSWRIAAGDTRLYLMINQALVPSNTRWQIDRTFSTRRLKETFGKAWWRHYFETQVDARVKLGCHRSRDQQEIRRPARCHVIHVWIKESWNLVARY